MKLKSVVAIAALEAAIKRLGIKIAAKTLPISMAIELGHFLIERDFFGSIDVYDGTGAIDEFMLDFFKTLTDSSNFSDDAVNAFNKVLNDNPSFSHTEVLDFYKNLANVADVTDKYISHFAKPLVDAANTSDSAKHAFGKDVKNIADIVDSDYKAFSKALVEAPSLMDAIDTIAFFKNTQDASNFTDDETLAFVKILSDGIGVTDDVDGTASTLDDQEMQYFKNLTNVTNITDTILISVAFVRAFSDNPSMSDIASLGISKSKDDGSLFTETHNFNFGKLISDTPIVGDALALQVTLAPFTDSSSVSDSADVVPNKVILENSTSITDAGSLRSQGYSDFSFFAEDFVGASRNF